MTAVDVAIVGAGPVGLMLACQLSARGVRVQVIERSAGARQQSRAIGVHPPGLQCLSRIDACERLVAQGVPIREAIAFAGARSIGSINFTQLPGPYRFVLSVPQATTEAVLERRLAELSPRAIRRGTRLSHIGFCDGGARLGLQAVGSEARDELGARFVVGCDGKHSTLRRLLAIPYRGASYFQFFTMGDVPDETGFGPTAAVFLTPEGVIESFPLPNGQRRWVVGGRSTCPASLTAMVRRHTGFILPTGGLTSRFAAEHYRARSLVQHRALLAGDAAHVISPIGGQGMNLGWLNAQLLCETLCLALDDPRRWPALGRAYDRAARAAARRAQRRSELYLRVVRRGFGSSAEHWLLRLALSPPLKPAAARLFTMHGVPPRNTTLQERC